MDYKSIANEKMYSSEDPPFEYREVAEGNDIDKMITKQLTIIGIMSSILDAIAILEISELRLNGLRIRKFNYDKDIENTELFPVFTHNVLESLHELSKTVTDKPSGDIDQETLDMQSAFFLELAYVADYFNYNSKCFNSMFLQTGLFEDFTELIKLPNFSLNGKLIIYQSLGHFLTKNEFARLAFQGNTILANIENDLRLMTATISTTKEWIAIGCFIKFYSCSYELESNIVATFVEILAGMVNNEDPTILIYAFETVNGFLKSLNKCENEKTKEDFRALLIEECAFHHFVNGATIQIQTYALTTLVFLECYKVLNPGNRDEIFRTCIGFARNDNTFLYGKEKYLTEIVVFIRAYIQNQEIEDINQSYEEGLLDILKEIFYKNSYQNRIIIGEAIIRFISRFYEPNMLKLMSPDFFELLEDFFLLDNIQFKIDTLIFLNQLCNFLLRTDEKELVWQLFEDETFHNFLEDSCNSNISQIASQAELLKTSFIFLESE